MDERVIEAVTFLGLEIPFTSSDLKRAYHKFAILYHPDKHTGASQSELVIIEDKMKQVNAANDLLNDYLINPSNYIRRKPKISYEEYLKRAAKYRSKKINDLSVFVAIDLAEACIKRNNGFVNVYEKINVGVYRLFVQFKEEVEQYTRKADIDMLYNKYLEEMRYRMHCAENYYYSNTSVSKSEKAKYTDVSLNYDCDIYGLSSQLEIIDMMYLNASHADRLASVRKLSFKLGF